MSKYNFKITYRNENEYGQYWGDNRYTVSIIAETLEQAKQKLDEIEKNEYRKHKNILEWGAEEIIEEKDKEIERLTAESTEWESKFYDEAKKVDKAIEYLESYNIGFKNCKFGEAPISIRELGDLLDILKGVDKE